MFRSLYFEFQMPDDNCRWWKMGVRWGEGRGGQGGGGGDIFQLYILSLRSLGVRIVSESILRISDA